MELFVDVRNLITAPQMAAYNIWEALFTGDPTTIETAIGTGIGDVDKAIVNFPIAVVTDIFNALQADVSSSAASTLLGDLSADLSNIVPTLATDVAGLLPGDVGTMVSAALAAF